MDQLAFFPTPLPGEDFRSILYRYHIYAINREILDTNIELYGSRNEFTVFPRGLDSLFNKLPQQRCLTIESIIKEHSLLSWFLPFIPDSHQKRILHEIKVGGNPSESYVGKLAGNKYGRCIASEIKYCPICIEEDTAKYGTGYIHLKHQFAFIHICHKHDAMLVSECVCGEKLGYWGMNGFCKNGHPAKNGEKQKTNRIHRELVTDLEAIFETHSNLTLGLIRQRLLEHLNAKGYLSTDGKARRKVLVRDFLEHFSSEDFKSVGLTEEHIMQRNTLERALWEDSLVYINLPLLLMLIRFLGGSFTDFLSKSLPYSSQIPFGLGPWPCKNKYCPDSGKLLIKKCVRIDNKYRGVTGKFCCPTCELEYAIIWNQTKEIKEKNTHVYITQGKRDRINEQYLSGRSVEEVAKQLYCSVGAVRATITELAKGSKSTEKHKLGRRAAGLEIKRSSYRAKVEAFMKAFPGDKRYQICLKSKTAYEWLKKHDAAWLEQRLPNSKSTSRFDWDEVDKSLSERVEEVASLLIESNPPTRVGIYSILRVLTKTESGRIKNYSEHLLKTRKALEEVAETKEQYQLRHLPALVRQLRTNYNYKEVTIDTILSYRRSYRATSKKMRRLISHKLTEIQREE